jgi:hypothetical protein
VHTSKLSSHTRQLSFPMNIILLVGSLLVIVGIYIFLLKVVVAATQPTDLDQDYIAAYLLVQGHSIYTYTENMPATVMNQAIMLNGYTGLPAANNHPPFDAILCIQLVFVSYTVAAVLWSVLSLILYILIGKIILSELQMHLPPLVDLATGNRAVLVSIAITCFDWTAFDSIEHLCDRMLGTASSSMR